MNSNYLRSEKIHKGVKDMKMYSVEPFKCPFLAQVWGNCQEKREDPKVWYV